MNVADQPKMRRVLIASSHGLFAQGLRSLLRERQAEGVEVVGVVSNLDQALAALEKLSPDLVIVDYDDEILNRDEFLARFVEGEKKLRVVLLSLQGGSEAIVYDRRTLAAAQIGDWLDEWAYSDEVKLSTADGNYLNADGQNRRVNMKPSKNVVHLVLASIVVLAVSAGVIYLLLYLFQNNLLFPIAASTQAVPIDNLFRGELIVIGFLFSLIVVLMIYSMIVFRRKRGDQTDAAHVEGNSKLEIAWTVIPLITVLGFAVWGGQALKDTLVREKKPVIIRVVGQQWSWRFEYLQPDGSVIVSDILRMPINRQAELRLVSNDVIHSFWVPEFRVKQDALPGGENFMRKLYVTPDRAGDYKLRCAELCGEKHALMESVVSVISQADFDAWVAAELGLSADPVARGQKWATAFGCQACHSVDGAKSVGPTWKALFGSQVELADGTTVAGDDAYLRNSIINPNAQIHTGFQPNLMPQNFGQQLTEQQILDVIEYIKTLK
jgi:cytochrome c oxidase subunit II